MVIVPEEFDPVGGADEGGQGFWRAWRQDRGVDFGAVFSVTRPIGCPNTIPAGGVQGVTSIGKRLIQGLTDLGPVSRAAIDIRRPLNFVAIEIAGIVAVVTHAKLQDKLVPEGLHR